MRLAAYGHGVDVTQQLRARIEERILAELGQFGRRVGRVTVRLHRPADDGGDLWTCHILVELLPSGGLGLGDTGCGPLGALDRAVGRLATAVALQLSIKRGHRDSRATAYALR